VLGLVCRTAVGLSGTELPAGQVAVRSDELPNARAVSMRWRFLHTDPFDVGCKQGMEILHVHAVLVGTDPKAARRRYPGVAAHLQACGPCARGSERPAGRSGRRTPDLPLRAAVWIWC